ncbi:MAG: hypothetical protein H6509_03485 [Bryobacterales bacterium]|nr:hypothetical protein [Bryobacterales bacterium]
MRRLAVCLFFVSIALDAKPLVFYRGVFNSASFAPAGVANAAIARGSIFSIFGRDLGPAASPALAFPLPSSLGGVEVDVCRGASCLAAIPLFVSTGQINAIMPSNAPLGAVSLRVRFDGEDGNFVPVTVAEASVGVFTVNSRGFGPAILQNFVAQGNTPLNSNVAAAQPGQVAILWATGLGAAPEADNLPPQGGTLPTQVEVWVGAEPVTNILYAGRAPGIAGLDQINFVVPQNAPHGCFVPVHVRTNGRTVSNGVTMAIGDAAACEDAHNPLQTPLTMGGRVGALFAQQVTFEADVDPVAATTDRSDWAGLALRQEAPNPYAFDPVAAWPPVGSCVTYQVRGDLRRGPHPIPSAGVRYLDGGDLLTVMTGSQTTTIAAAIGGYFSGRLAGGFSKPSSNFAPSSTFSATTAGGADVGALNVQSATGPDAAWTNRNALTAITPGEPLVVTWSPPGSPALAVIGGGSVDPKANVTALFACVADAAAGSFTAPGWATANLPPTSERLWEADAYLGLGVAPRQSSASALAGLDALLTVYTSWDAKNVRVNGGAR